MKKMLVVIIILVVILVGMVIYRNIENKNQNQVTIPEINEIQEYISKIYMWKEVTTQALPTFENINEADEVWIWEVVKKVSENYEFDYDQLQKEAKEIFGNDLQIQFPREGNQAFQYDETIQKYVSTQTNLDEQEDLFLLNKIEKAQNEYNVEIIEYIEDYSQEQNIIIMNLQGEQIGQVENSESENKVQEIIKNNENRFNKKQLKIKRNDDNKLNICSSKE